MESDKKLVEETMKSINNAWLKGNTDELQNYFHKDMVIVHPNFRKRAEGADECVKTYASFVENSELIALKQNEMMIDIYEDTAIAAYLFNIRYRLEDEFFEESGKDMFVFRKYNDKWLAVWRTIVPSIETR